MSVGEAGRHVVGFLDLLIDVLLEGQENVLVVERCI